MKKATILFAMIMTLVLTVIATGCAQSAKDNVSISESGQIILSVNPEIAVHYNKEGLVTKIEGVNNDGKTIVDNVTDYIGRDCRDVVKELVKQINEAGYFVMNENGTYNDITIHVVAGSHLPNAKFFDNITDDVRQTVGELNLNVPVAVRAGGSDYGSTDYNDSQYGNSNSNNSGYNDSGYNDSAYGDSGYNVTSITIAPKPNNSGNSNYNDSAYGNSGYNDSAYGDSGYSTPAVRPTPQSNNNSGYGDSGYSDYGNSGYSGYGDSGYSGYGNS